MRQETDIDIYLFGPIVVKVRQDGGVWRLTPHGVNLGHGMAAARSALCGKSVIEIGTGSGAHAIAALKLGARYIDVTEIDEGSLHTATNNAALNQVAFRNAWLRDWFYFDPPESYDVVICNPPFGVVREPDRRHYIKTMIQESTRFLRSGGHLFFCQSSMADFPLTQQELTEAGFVFDHVFVSRGVFRDYYFTEPKFMEDARRVENGYELIDGVFVETLKTFLCTKR